MKKALKWLGIILLIVAIGIQFVTIDKDVPEFDPTGDMLVIEQAPEAVANIMRKACYDCHSYETTYPWYSNVAPVSWWLQDHVEHAREHLNFSLWRTLQHSKRAYKLSEVAEEVREKIMPLEGYAIMHPEADLSDEQRALIIDWVESK